MREPAFRRNWIFVKAVNGPCAPRILHTKGPAPNEYWDTALQGPGGQRETFMRSITGVGLCVLGSVAEKGEMTL